MRTLLGLLGLLLLIAGCADNQTGYRVQFDYQRGDFARVAEQIKPLAAKTDENYVLNNDRLGSAAIAEYDLPTAESAFLKSYEVINSANVNDGGRAVSAAVISESTKIWKGEPYERAMVNYYLGLVYYIRHDYNNSRAAFENALFKLKDYADPDHPDQYATIDSDFSLGYLMLGKCYQHLNQPDKAKQMFDTAAKVRPDLASLAQWLSQPSNMLLVIDWDWGPRKLTNVDHAFVGFGPTPEQAGPIALPFVYVDGTPAQLQSRPYPTIDLLALAQDRRWQDIDTIRAIKSIAGKALMVGGAFEAAHGSGMTGHRENNTDLAVGLGLIAAGALLDASSQADLRQWEMLPRSVFLVPLNLPPGRHDVSVNFPSGEQQTWRGLVAPAQGGQGEETYYFRMLEGGPPSYTWPPQYLAGQPGVVGQ
jgi:tetratricopeptide (TPR) repeat protein